MRMYFFLAVCTLVIFTFWFVKTYFTKLSGRIYRRVFFYVKKLYRGGMSPIKWLYFLYFPNHAAFREEIHKLKYQYKHQKDGRYCNADHLQLLRHVRFSNISVSALHSPASTFSLILTYLSLILSFVFYFLPQPTGLFHNPVFWQTMLVLAVLLLIPIPIYLRLYILNLPLEEYGSISRNHLSESEMVCHISYKIYEICSAFDHEVTWLEQEDLLINKDLSNQFFPSEGRFVLTDQLTGMVHRKVNGILGNRQRLYRLRLRLQSSERELQRISILIANLSRRLDVSEIELCEHVFQFDPRMYKVWMKKFNSNLHVAINLIDDCFPDDRSKSYTPQDLEDATYDRIRSLLYECHRFFHRNRKFALYQVQNIAFRDLHPVILSLASQPSSCEATKIYLKLLHDVFHAYFISGENRLISGECFFEKTKYVYRKRKIHLGLDLHYSAARLLQEMIRKKEMAHLGLERQMALAAFFSPDNFQTTFRKNSHDLKRFLADTGPILKDIIQFYTCSIPFIGNCRKDVRDYFESCYDFLFRDLEGDQEMYIIILGRSKIVRDVFKYTIPQMIRTLDDTGQTINIKERVKGVVFMNEEEWRLEARSIKYDLTEETKRNYLSVKVSNPEFILPLLSKRSRILILMGAEAFDLQKRVARTSVYKKQLCDLLRSAVPVVTGNPELHWEPGADIRQFPEIKVLVFAESYKLSEDLGRIEHYFGDQNEKIEMYEGSLITEVIYDSCPPVRDYVSGS